eukprot:959947_1
MAPISSLQDRFNHPTVLFFCILLACTWSLSCDIPYECSNQSYSNSIVTATVGAYKGAAGSSTSITSPAVCLGSFSCAFMHFIHPKRYSFRCYGSFACSSTTILSHIDNIQCYGSHSCMSSFISSQYVVMVLHCYGYASCAQTHILLHEYETLVAGGAFSLYKSTIETVSDKQNNITITLSGQYAAYGATFTCGFGFTCNIHCNTRTSCLMFYVNCIGECVVHTQSDYTITPLTNTTDIELDPLDELFDSQYIAVSPDTDCNTNKNSVKYDNYDQIYVPPMFSSSESDIGPICCRAGDACMEGSPFGYTSPASGDVICSGAKACEKASQINANHGIIICNGAFSCTSAAIMKTDCVYCMGSGACLYSIVDTVSHLVCSGANSCEDATIRSAGRDLTVYFTGYLSGNGASIVCHDECEIICAAADSCTETTTLRGQGSFTVKCNTDTGCPLGWNATETDPTIDPTTIDPTVNPITPSSTADDDPTESPIQYVTTGDPTSDNTSNDSSSSKSENSDTYCIISAIIGVLLLLIICIFIYKYILRTTHRNTPTSDEKQMSFVIDRADVPSDHNGGNTNADRDRSKSHDQDDGKDEDRDEGDGVDNEPGMLKLQNEASADGESENTVIRTWLTETVGLKQYYSMFIENGYDSLEFISKITTAKQLADIGIVLKGHQTQIMTEIEQLNNPNVQYDEPVTVEGAGADTNNDHSERNQEQMKPVNQVHHMNMDSGQSNDMYVVNESPIPASETAGKNAEPFPITVNYYDRNPLQKQQ